MIKCHNILVLMFAIAINMPLVAACQLEIAKEATRSYYEDGEYERDLVAIVEDVRSHVSQPAAHDKQAIILDVDDVALSSYPFFKAHDFGAPWATWCSAVQEGNLPSVTHIKMLYHYLQNLGYKIIFLTSRSSKFHEATARNLIAAGYSNFEKLITRSSELHGPVFKEQERITLIEEGYEIVCCLDDLEKNLTGAHVGYAVKIPNRLYS